MRDLAWTFPAGKLVTNYAAIGAVTFKKFTVPAGKRWIMLYGMSERDASATFLAELYDASDNLLTQINATAAGTSNIHLPYTTSSAQTPNLNIMLDAGWYIKYTYGAAQTNPKVTCVVLEMDA